MAAYMAPGVSNIIVYEGTNWNDVLNRMATDNLASQLSSSWGFSPTNATTEQIFKQMIAQGQSLFQASGDSGAYQGGDHASGGRPECHRGWRHQFDHGGRGRALAIGDHVGGLRRRRQHHLADSELSTSASMSRGGRIRDHAQHPRRGAHCGHSNIPDL